jgi:hypothetical protein
VTRANGLRVVSSIFAFVAAFAMAVWLTQPTAAHEFPTPFRFRFPESMSVLNWLTTQNLTNSVSGTISDYNSTHLTVNAGPIQKSPFIGDYGNIIYYDADYGASHWISTARQTMSQLQPCFDWDSLDGHVTGNCGVTGNSRADFAYLAFNTYERYSGNWLDTTIAQHAVSHEFGHPLGLSHCPCDEAISIMNSWCDILATTLQAHDTGEINWWY